MRFVDVYPWQIYKQFDDDNLIQSTILFSLNDNAFQSVKLLPNSRLHFTSLNDRAFEDIGSLARNRIEDYSLQLIINKTIMYFQLLVNIVLRHL